MYFPLSSALCTVSMKWPWRRSGNMARRPSSRITTFLLRTVRGFFLFFLSFFPFFLSFSWCCVLICILSYIGTIKLLALISTCNWLVMLEKVKAVPHMWGSASHIPISGHPHRPPFVWVSVHWSPIRMKTTKMESCMLTASVVIF